ncbi:hypothetical protein BJ875DRAFT_285134 [Amylocarpus encephaloides]|uniref:Required for respiratory growth protein 7, mitochondrial n=1 Tax=Amylocarpus encephaloides TaxID=45428 RepID=A0A9P8C9U9_9HELO|nr:hypothetical protein BJ875DRAFT_285134 [Amylocarpus encephaloides]
MLWTRASRWLTRPTRTQCSDAVRSSSTLSEELTYPESPSAHHNDLPSFLEYASRIELDKTSTTYVGTHYEYTVLHSLARLGLSLKRIGGKSDHGIDLLGTWCLPSQMETLKVLVQCKALARKAEPSLVRELEGAFVGAPTGWRGSGALAFLVTQKTATKGVREALGRSRWPMGFITCESDGKLLQMLWNRRAAERGLEGIGVEVKYEGGDYSEKEILLTWKGDII